ncbi:hypothetical protein EDC01DRAFT_610192 [Geopyxis carbonaria]|nr:hypothetical protein EDC01DRAFT_610192 [Geopyxis carbonaria]
MDTEHGTCKGYGFARYETIEEAENCIRGLVSLKYEAGFARESFNARLKTLADPNSTNVYVSNLPRDMNEKAMQDIFAGYVVVSNRILRDANGSSRGVGFARFESREICNDIIKKFHGTPVGDERLPLQVRYADTSAQKRLKATTTKKRQFRANEYNSVVNNYHVPFPVAHQPHMYSRNRVWLRQNAMGPNTYVQIRHNDENKHSDYKSLGGSWRHASGSSVGPDNLLKLETVHEKDDTVSESHSDGTTVPNILDYGITTSSGSFSDPGDSYGGREYGEDNISIL